MAPRIELREFLRSRRARVQPEEVGVPPAANARRVPGLRREEVAQLAGVSVDYYTRLEQGRDINVSEDVLRAVAKALLLTDDERSHLFDLAQPTRARRRPSAPPVERVRSGVLRLLDSVQAPAFVCGRRTDILALSPLARALFTELGERPPEDRNHARWVFLDPLARQRYPRWEEVARDAVAALRMQAGRYPDDALLAGLVGELTVRSPEFAELWADHDVLVQTHGVKVYDHPVVGEVTVTYEALPIPDAVDQTLFVYSTEPGSPSARALDLLASWSLEAADR
ncbi:MAG: helix-turn-helix domain-containing protein [Solirubrobacteraceae bacterium]|nr:helix-turn-helix domain-containing protein [Solirubrobacteraceae bacterium]